MAEIDDTTDIQGAAGVDKTRAIISPIRKSAILNADDVTNTDNAWIADSFMVKTTDLDDPYDKFRFMSVADNKFTDTSMGGNVSINCFPQFTRYSDIRAAGILNGRSKHVNIASNDGDNGMGRYYAEAIDDNSTNVYFEFGVPEFNNVLYFLMSAVNYKQAVIANTGRTPIMYNVGNAIGTAAVLIAFPVITIAILIAKVAVDVLASNGRFDQYYLKPTMFTYWSSVNTIVTMMATELGILSPVFMDDKKDSSMVGVPLKIDQDDMNEIRKMMPGIITKGNGLNVHAMVAKSQIMFNQHMAARMEALDNLTEEELVYEGDKDDYTIPIRQMYVDQDNVTPSNLWESLNGKIIADKDYIFGGAISDLAETLKGLTDSAAKEIKELFESNDVGQFKRKLRKQDDSSWISKAKETAQVVMDEGARYAVFRVAHIGSSSETFSNSTTTIDISNKINSLGSTYRSIKFDLGGGEIPVVSDVAKGLTELAVGALSGVTLGLSNVIAGFLSGASVEVQKRWQDSSVSLPTHTFKMELVSPSAHPVAQLQNLYIPAAAIMAGALPLATGPKSYTSPLLCNMFIRGGQTISLGMITSLTITRGTSNLPMNKQRRPLALEITFTVTDFAEMISAPVSSDLLSLGSGSMDDTNGLNRYIQALTARDLYSTSHVWDRAKINMSRVMENIDISHTGEYWGARGGDLMANTNLFSLFGNKNAVNYSENF